MDSSKESILGELEYIKQIQSEVETIDTIDEIDINPYVLTTYQVHDYVLRRYPPTKTGGGNPHKYENFKNVEAFQHCCATNRLDPFTPSETISSVLRIGS